MIFRINHPPFLFFFFLFLLPSFKVAEIITPGSILFASNTGQSWTSDNETFSLGFIPLNPQTSPPSFLAAISYSGGVPIWSAGTTPVDVSASLHFLSTGTLRLLNGSGHILWDSNTEKLGVSSASLEENGNLVLRNGNAAVWSSFDNPVDTIVPTQNFTVGKVLLSGVYSFSLLSFGNITLRWNNSITYWSEGLNSSFNSGNTSLTSPSLGLQTVGTLSLFDQTLPAVGAVMVYSDDYAEGGDVLRFLKLDNDGNLRIYSSERGSGTQTVRWAAVEDQCRVYGYCGDMGICSYNATGPLCGCPSQNFDLVDPNDSRKGCKRKMELEDCPGNLTMLDLEHTLLLTYPPQSIFAGGEESEVFFVAVSACRLNCLRDATSCEGSTLLSDGSGQCYLKRPGFLTGYWNPALPSTSHIKVCPPVIPNPLPSLQVSGENYGWKVQGWALIVEGVAIVLGLVSLEVGLWFWCCRNSSKSGGQSAQYALLEYASGAPVQFWYKDLQSATKGFKEKLGTGGFGSVYKGVLVNGMVVAVKQLEGIEQGEKQFRMEVGTISSTHHLNLVRLIGFCSEGRHRLLVYEFMKNGSLDQFLFNTDNNQMGKPLNWEQRFNIALGTAKAITYLHEECRDCIVHCDIKPENILLDENYTAKVSDFGLAKLIHSKEHRYKTLASIRGTRGYLAPEWIANLPITSKSDIYSYGMVLLEIVSGRRNFEVSAETNMKKFSVWAYEKFEIGNVEGIVDRRLADQEVDMEQVKRAIQVSFWCIQEQPSQRPRMGKIVQMLEGIAEIDRPPAIVANPEGSSSETSLCLSSNISSVSQAASAPDPPSSSAFQAERFSTFASDKNSEKASSSLLFPRN
ncbi:G-type lectin S-receptor-like serine/threonine-protein kinase At1g34300 [Ricinus communis]|uniref:Receptor-like serine/threonine-protein kinase n=1 Tax=Ricinus communis TaxID=3988 RepID=B9RW31_RICCO|nr:G-type lectin S-receptor-like serine/threonine-protein kinase At1g34300 [Ricinus communis]EEF44468.1 BRASSINOSTEROID INSENSITIVE 1-associated receptor kinase 1 precursor, putative [Ricinus communis]|eukprot:XP_002517950.1 G-type lectin S-receptor-like serine/threonine-protein kinase At1g34300 [Ricinus communis]